MDGEIFNPRLDYGWSPIVWNGDVIAKVRREMVFLGLCTFGRKIFMGIVRPFHKDANRKFKKVRETIGGGARQTKKKDKYSTAKEKCQCLE